ncbi:DUF11 domain-containing protein [Iamia majanohamensis]|uniref:DUF11 domain-containing protein n=1 Tax=Iamia majanohamensis TaxID=467976 RepID=A0AAE9Y6E2_9ACTN|nr:DUF11 domain-containing protein [Iamia majanohamensis]WCO65128.1 DUF11 domain-containing protein [Iamia majanohamensis]
MTGARTTTRRGRWAALAAAAVLGTGLLAPAAAGAQEPEADLSVAIGHSPSTAEAAVPFEVTLTATNDGPATATDVVLGVAFSYPLTPTTVPDGCETTLDGSALCTIGDLGAGASASRTLGLRPMASGVYVLPAAVSSPTPDPDVADRAASDTVIVRPGPSIGERYVAGTYPVVLGRPGTPEGRAFWADRFDAAFPYGQPPLETIPYGLITSGEHRRQRVQESYRRILGRSAEGDALTFWTAALGGAVSDARLDQLLLASGEFGSKHPSDVVDAVFRAVLRRAPSASERATWRSRLAAGTSRAAMAGALQTTTEGYDVVIRDRYQRSLGHGPDPFGRFVWQAELRQGTSPQRLWARLLVGGEYLAQYPPTQDDYDLGRSDAVYDFTDDAGAASVDSPTPEPPASAPPATTAPPTTAARGTASSAG